MNLTDFFRIIYYNLKYKGKFKMKRVNDYYEYLLPDGRIIKSYDSLVGDFGIFIEEYLKHYQPKENDIIVDAGAYVGAFSLYCAKLIEPGFIIAIEPNKNNFKRLLDNIELNGFKNIIPIYNGLWNTQCIMPLSDNDACSEVLGSCLSIPTEFDTLDNILKKVGFPYVDFIKLDVVGSEIQAVQGMKETLLNNSKVAIAKYPNRHLIYDSNL